jgi:CheY-like chemotaxis protein
MHGGRVIVESPGAGLGSRFTITLPWQPLETLPNLPAEKEPAPGALVMPSGRPAIILLADDNEVALMAVGDFLRSLSATLVTARDGQEALAQAQLAQPDLILMDIQMPNLNGLEAIRQLRAAPVTAQTPIIALTALAMPGDLERCLAAGANGYLSKPVNLGELAQAIARQLEGTRT